MMFGSMKLKKLWIDNMKRKGFLKQSWIFILMFGNFSRFISAYPVVDEIAIFVIEI